MLDKSTGKTVSQYRDLAQFQIRVAEQWFNRGEHSSDVFAKFFFFYTAFNALTFLWKQVNGVEGGDIPQIQNLVAQLDGTTWEEVAREFADPMRFFANRPIERMGDRTATDPSHGRVTEGRRHQRVLADPAADNAEKAKALASVLYIVRCNVAHGSKMIMGDDLNVIQNAVPLLRALSSRAIDYTKAAVGVP